MRIALEVFYRIAVVFFHGLRIDSTKRRVVFGMQCRHVHLCPFKEISKTTGAHSIKGLVRQLQTTSCYQFEIHHFFDGSIMGWKEILLLNSAPMICGEIPGG